MTALGVDQIVAVIGAGTMGAGIAQVAAAAGHPVLLFDNASGGAEAGRSRIRTGLDALAAKGRIAPGQASEIANRIAIAETLAQLAPASLVIEAIVEDLAVKQALFAQLETIVEDDAILASNTSSISLTAIAAGTKTPERVAGLHFFNPAPVMKLVEIVSGVATSRGVAETLFATATRWGKVAVHAKSTPGFIVNRVARAYYAEALRLYEEQVADVATIDALLTEGAGFRMGPFALMDLIGNDVNYAVSLSVFNSYYQDPRFRPSLTQLELVNAGHLGKKSGRGFYNYAPGVERPEPLTERFDTAASILTGLRLDGEAEIDGVLVARTDGRTAEQRAASAGKPCLLLDLIAQTTAKRVGFAASANVPEDFITRLVATLHSRSVAATKLPDWPGLVAMRTVAMLANEAFEAAMHGVASESGIDDAMRFGVNYPLGPIEWARAIGLPKIAAVLDAIHALTGDPRYRASLGLRMAASTLSVAA